MENWQGVDLTLNARLPKGALLQGGYSTGRLATDNCDVVAKVDNGPNGSLSAFGGIISFSNPVAVASPSSLYCKNTSPYLGQFKLAGVYRVPRVGVQLSGTVQSNPGPPISATFVATNAQIAPSLGRNLAGGVTTALVELMEPNQVFGDRLNQLDIRGEVLMGAAGGAVDV